MNGLKPLFLIKPGSVSRKDIRRVESGCGICMVECADPDAARYSEPPLGADLDEQARAALSLLRMVMDSPTPDFKRADLTRWFVNEILRSRKPDTVKPAASVKK